MTFEPPTVEVARSVKVGIQTQTITSTKLIDSLGAQMVTTHSVHPQVPQVDFTTNSQALLE